jgi:hypothetical protein
MEPRLIARHVGDSIDGATSNQAKEPLMCQRDDITRALQRASEEHGAPNTFRSAWLVEVEGCPLTRGQINAVGRRCRSQLELLCFWADGLGMAQAEYIGASWSVEQVYPA